MQVGESRPSWIYCDHNATSPLRPEAREAMLPWLGEIVGNASSVHAAGRAARDAVEGARESVANLVGAEPSQVVWTSGSTEANNLGLHAARGSRPSALLLAGATEHPSVRELALATAPSQLIPVTVDGCLDLRFLCAALESARGAIVSVMSANNETGVLNDIPAIAEAVHAAGGLVHTDATQQAGRLPVDFVRWDVDLMSISAHKFGGPQGVGALIIRRGEFPQPVPLFLGGHQERGWRSGTLNISGIVGMGAAADASLHRLDHEARVVRGIRDGFEAAVLSTLSSASVNGRAAARLPGVSSITLRGTPADAVLQAMPDVCASEGSACSAEARGPSHVLRAMGLDEDAASSTVRVSFGYTNVPTDAGIVAQRLAHAYELVRDLMGCAK